MHRYVNNKVSEGIQHFCGSLKESKDQKNILEPETLLLLSIGFRKNSLQAKKTLRNFDLHITYHSFVIVIFS